MCAIRKIPQILGLASIPKYYLKQSVQKKMYHVAYVETLIQ